MEAEKI